MQRRRTKLPKRRPGGIQVYDWPQLYMEFLKERRTNPRLTLQTWSNYKDLNYSFASKQFAHLARLSAGETLALLAPNAAERLGALVDNKDLDIAVRVSTAILDRSGHSPQAAVLTINNQNITQVKMPPLFKDDYAKAVNAFILDEEEQA